MVLNNSMKQIMAWCYKANNLGRYEFVMDKRSTPLPEGTSPFVCRLFLDNRSYWSLSVFDDSGNVSITEYYTTKTWWAPAPRVTYINKYLYKYRVKHATIGRLLYKAVVPLSVLFPLLDKMNFNHSSNNAWNTMNRMEIL